MRKNNRSLLTKYILLMAFATIILPLAIYIAQVIFPEIIIQYNVNFAKEEMNRDTFYNRYSSQINMASLIILIGIFIIFMAVSYIFFNSIRKRLVRLETVMALPEDKTTLKPISISKKDEIGNLEKQFNQMVEQLTESRKKEQNEEKVRQELIANLSHDLRTPLTSLRGQVYSLKKNHSDIEREETIESIDNKISYMGDLIENLLSYTLLSSEKYPYTPERLELVRLVRRYFADWYDTLEAKNFEIYISLPEEPVYGRIDENLLRRMMDNVIQNVIRHASEGKYISLELLPGRNQHTLKIMDKGPGFEDADKNSEGSGLGLSILSMITKMMNIEWKIDTRDTGTIILFLIDNTGKSPQ